MVECGKRRVGREGEKHEPTPALCNVLLVYVLLNINCRIARFARYSKELRQCCRQVDEVNRLSDIVAKAGFDAFILNIGHDIGGQRNDGQLL